MNPDFSLILDILLNKTVIIGYIVFLIVLFIIRIITFLPGEENSGADAIMPQSTTVLVNDGQEDDEMEEDDDMIDEDEDEDGVIDEDD
ncbi:MAG: hypothetical protein ACRCVN_00620 [Spirochaetia bacterium]